MNYNYRIATEPDIPQLIELGIRSYESHAALLGDDRWAQMRARLSDAELYPKLMQRATGFVCSTGGELVGMVFLVPSGEPSQHFPIEWAHVRVLGVAPEHRRNGISRRLMLHCIEAARNRGERTLGLHTGAFMGAARKLYAALGFRIERELVPIFDQPYSLFRLDL